MDRRVVRQVKKMAAAAGMERVTERATASAAATESTDSVGGGNRKPASGLGM